jgi:LmbE family N-acetylglucosaminyl deacetylase
LENQALTGLEAFAEVKRAIVVCAHADDMETMMGGTLWLLTQAGVEFYELICTQGDLGSNDPSFTRLSLAAVRREEAVRGAQMLGVKEVAVLDHHDGELVPGLDLRAQIAGYFRRWQPDTVFTFDPDWPGQVHPDHRAAGRAAVDAIMPSKMKLYHPEQLAGAQTADPKRVFLFSPAQPSIFVDVAGVYERKVAASLAHASQFPGGEEALQWMRELDAAAAGRAGLDEGLVEHFAPLRVW